MIKIGIIGDRNPNLVSHIATDEALSHAARALSVTAQSSWLPTQQLAEGPVHTALSQFDALWCSSGGPYESTEGALAAIQFAREEGWPFIGT
jgi:CTP synthase (UTP-ammonia lyase)